MIINHSTVLAIAAVSEGLTFQKVIDDIPTDPTAMVVYTLMLGSLALVAWSNRPRGNGDK